MRTSYLNSLLAFVALLISGLPGPLASGQTPAGQHATAGKDVGTQGEPDWVDARWNQTDVGPFLASSLKTPDGMIAKGLSIRVGSNAEATVCYDTKACVFRGGWLGGFVKFSAHRFGLLDAPVPDGEWFITTGKPNWLDTTVRHEALHLNGHRVVLDARVGETPVRESPWFEQLGGVPVFSRSFEVGPGGTALTQKIFSDPSATASLKTNGTLAVVERKGKIIAFARSGSTQATLSVNGGDVLLTFPPRTGSQSAKLLIWSGAREQLPAFEKIAANDSVPENLAELAKPGPARWLPALTNAGQVGLATDGFTVDTITVPYANPWKALMFCSGVDFFRDGSAAVCTIHGDVWRVSGLDDRLRTVTWKRFATGLFQPLGLRVVNDGVHVLGRDQVTVLHDENGDGEADRYENFCNLIDTSTGGHDYATCLERDAAGNFYYVDPSGVQRISADGKAKETLATGFRNANGLGVGPGPIITVAPQQGEWTPSSVIHEIKRGGFYGYRGPKVTPERPLGYDAPLCWVPHSFDNSSSSQTWVPEGRWGPLGGHMLHLLWGRCTMALVLRDVVDGQAQGAVVSLPARFLSGPMRGSFNPKDGHLYIAGSTGWQTSAAKDGCLQRVRYTASAPRMPVAWHAHRNGILLTFAQLLDREAAGDAGRFALSQWNYRYAAQYGSKDYSVAHPDQEGHDDVEVRSARLHADGKSVFIETAELRPVMQMELKYNLRFASGASASGPLYLTLNRLDAPAEANRR